MRNMKRPANSCVLTKDENACLELLLQAQDLFEKICKEEPQNPSDTYNFGHYSDAAMNAVLLRGLRRLDPDNFMPTYAGRNVTTELFDALIAKMSDHRRDETRRQLDESENGD